MKNKKKKVLGILISNFKTYFRYSWVTDEEQKKRWSQEKTNFDGVGNKF